MRCCLCTCQGSCVADIDWQSTAPCKLPIASCIAPTMLNRNSLAGPVRTLVNAVVFYAQACGSILSQAGCILVSPHHAPTRQLYRVPLETCANSTPCRNHVGCRPLQLWLITRDNRSPRSGVSRLQGNRSSSSNRDVPQFLPCSADPYGAAAACKRSSACCWGVHVEQMPSAACCSDHHDVDVAYTMSETQG